ncbi:hypothetical protein EDC04DRAFT_2755611, partial [Pisolithus marmoratus]
AITCFFTLGGHLTLFSRFDQFMTSTKGQCLLLSLLSPSSRAAFCKIRTSNTVSPSARTDPIPPCWSSAAWMTRVAINGKR